MSIWSSAGLLGRGRFRPETCLSVFAWARRRIALSIVASRRSFLAAALSAAAIDARLGGERPRTNPVPQFGQTRSEPQRRLQILSGGFRRLEMRGVKLRLGHGETLIVLGAPEQVGCRFLDTHDLRDISDIQGSSSLVVRRTGSRSASPPDKTDIARSAQHRRA